MQIVLPLTQMNHPALPVERPQSLVNLLDVSEVQSGSYDTVSVFRKSVGVPKFHFDVWAMALCTVGAHARFQKIEMIHDARIA